MSDRFKRADDRPLFFFGVVGVLLAAGAQAGFVPAALSRLMVPAACLSWAVMVTLMSLRAAATGRVQIGDHDTGYRFYKEHEPRRFALALAAHAGVAVIFVIIAGLAVVGDPFPHGGG